MSHNIKGKCKAVSVVDLEDELVQDLAKEKLKWRFLGKGRWKAYSGQQDVNADMLVAVPISQGSPYAHKLTPEEKKNLGIDPNEAYSVIAVTGGKATKVPGSKEKPKQEGIEVTMDSHGMTGSEKNVDVFMRNVTQCVNGARVIKKTNKMMNVLGQAIAQGKAPPGAKVLGPGAIKAAVMNTIGAAKKGTLKA